jgi:hypothetical protein
MKSIPKLPSGEKGSEERAQLTDEQMRVATIALQKVDELAAKISGHELQLEQHYRTIFGATSEESRERVIWRGIIRFANANSESVTLDMKEIKSFFYLLVYCTQADVSGNTGMEDFFETFSDVRNTAERFGAGLDVSRASGGILMVAFSILCKQYQPQLKSLLTWLCAPRNHKDRSSEALAFLGKHASGVDARPDFSDASFDENAVGYCAFYYWKTVRYQSLMSPICRFIFDRVEQYHEWLERIPKHLDEKLKDDEASAREKAVPIRICDRPDCGKFLVPQRTGRKKYCSTACLLKAQPQRSREENKAYMCLYRLEQCRSAVLRAKLKSRSIKERLEKIEKEWPEYGDRVKRLKLRAERKQKLREN